MSLVLGFCRLAILDLSPAGNQPMTSADGRLHIVLNGEIYNHLELRDELERLGMAFHTRSDTEVLLAAYQHWGAACLPRLVGMFAFAVVDTREHTLLLARDHVGMKPLYYSFTSDGLAFASQVSALLELTGAPAVADRPRLQQFLLGGAFDHGQATFFSGVRQVRPGHSLLVPLDDPRKAEQAAYWRIRSDTTTDLAFPEATSRLRELLTDSVRMHLRSDVPVAAALSGGMDSSSVVSLMRHLMPPAEDLHTFTFVSRGQPGFDPAWDEETWANVVGTAARATMHKVRVDPRRLPEEFPALMRMQDGPFSSPVIWVQEQVFRSAHEAGFRVMMSGQGSDELTAGYHRHTIARLSSLLRQGRLGDYRRLYRVARREADQPNLWKESLRGALPAAWKHRARRAAALPDWVQRENWIAAEIDEPAYPDTSNRLRLALQRDMEVAPLPALLRYEDRNSMAHSVEDRLPFLDPRIIEFIFTLPENFLISPDGRNKHILREAMRGIVPDAVLDRRDKMAFPVPAAFWLLELREWVDGVLKDSGDVPLLDPAAIRRHWQDFVDRGGGSPVETFLLWRWIFVLGWARSFNVRLD